MNPTKQILACVCAAILVSASAVGQSLMTVTVGASAPQGSALPSDFVGLSFGTKTLLPTASGMRFFDATNKALLTLFQNLGIKHLRLGGTSVESPPTLAIPDQADIDSLFAFAKAAGVEKIIYSLRLLENAPGLHYAETNAALAQYIWRHYRPYLDCFAIGNEPDRKPVYAQDLAITNFATYIKKWRTFAAAITNAVPEAKFAGPDAGSGNVEWTTQLTEAEKNSGRLALVTEHFYVGGGGRGKAPDQAIEAMLSPRWVARNEALYNKVALLVFSNSLPLRVTEANDHFTGGVPEASNTAAGALWALDFLHWWAAHGARGVNFHNTQWVVNDVITPGPEGELTINPKGYGLRAFALGSQGKPEHAAIANPDGLNLTVYAMRGPKQHFVTLINKEYGPGARDATATIVAGRTSGSAAVIYLTIPKGDVRVRTGVTLGGDSIQSTRTWRGKWTPLKPDKQGQCLLKVPAVSAAIVELQF